MESHGQRRSRSKSRGKIRAYLYGSNHDVLQTSSDDDNTNTGVVGAARDVRKRISRRASSITSPHTKSSATRLSNSSSSGLLSTHSTEISAIDPEESAMVADQIKQRAYYDTLAAQNHVPTPVDEDKHVDSIMAPLRRKSLYTPGIATRCASDILRKPPKPLMDHDYYYDPSRPETSPLSHLAALSMSEDGRSTPCDLHYTQLGGLELGTLRVVNGAGSPALGDHSLRSITPESKIYDEYYTASEGSVAGDGKHATCLPPGGDHSLKNESQSEDGIRTDNHTSKDLNFFPLERISFDESPSIDKEGADHANQSEGSTSINDTSRWGAGISDGSSSFRDGSSKTRLVEATEPSDLPSTEDRASITPASFEDEPRNETRHLDEEISDLSWPLTMAPPKSYNPNWEILDESFASKIEVPTQMDKIEGTPSNVVSSETRSFKRSSAEGKSPYKCSPVERKTTNDALDSANAYIAELEGSPFFDSSVEDKKDISSLSQESAKETWRFFINDAEVQRPSDSDCSRENAFRKLTVNSNMAAVWKPEHDSVPPFQPSQPLRHSAPSELPLANDSSTATPADAVRFKSESYPTSSTTAVAPLQPHTIETNRSSARSPFRLPTRMLKKQRPKSQPPPENSITKYHDLSDANIPRIPSILAAKHANRLSQFPLLEHTFPSPQHTTANDAFSSIVAYDAPIRFPFSANSLETAATTFKRFSTTSSDIRASAVIRDEDDWGIPDLVRSPSWSDFGRSRRRKGQKKLAKEAKGMRRGIQNEEWFEKRLQNDGKEPGRQNKKDGDKEISTSPSAASRMRASSSEYQSQHDMEMAIADLGTVVDSLGNSPYDIARPTCPNPQITRNSTHHQNSTATSSLNSSFGPVSRAQSMFLNMPSVPALAAVDLKAHNLEWVRNRQRSQTNPAPRPESSSDRGSIPREMIQPHGVTMEVKPSVPATSPANQVQRPEGSRMTAEAPKLNSPLGQIEEQNVTTYPSISGATNTSRKTKDSKIVPALWSNGSLERKSPKTVHESGETSEHLISGIDNSMTVNDSVWDTYSHAWSERRKSAGETLLRDRVRGAFDSGSAKPALPRASTCEAYKWSLSMPGHLGPLPNPLASHPGSRAQQPIFAPNTLDSYGNQFIGQQAQQYSFSPVAPPLRPSTSLLQHGGHYPTPSLSHAPSQPFQIQRKRVGSGPSSTRAETKSVLV